MIQNRPNQEDLKRRDYMEKEKDELFFLTHTVLLIMVNKIYVTTVSQNDEFFMENPIFLLLPFSMMNMTTYWGKEKPCIFFLFFQ